MTDTLEALRHLVREKFDIDIDKLDATKSVVDSGLDSLALTELLFAAEDRFGVQLLEAAREVRSLADLARVIDQRQDEKSRATPIAPAVPSS